MKAQSARISFGRRLDGLLVVGLLGCLLALLLGAIAATSHGVLAASALVAIGLGTVAVVLYQRDPVLALIWLWLFQIFNAPLSATFGYFSPTGEAIRQGNEVLVALFVVLTVWHVLRSDTRPPPILAVAPTVALAAIGILGDLLHAVPLKITLVGAWLGLKLWILVLATLVLPWRRDDPNRIYRVLVSAGVLIGGLGFVDYFTHGAVSHALHTSIVYSASGTYRAQAVQSILASPGEYSLFMSLLFALTISRLVFRFNRSDLLLSLLFAASAILSLRLKGVLSLGAVVIIVVLVQSVTNLRGALVGLAVGAVLFGGIYAAEKSVISKQLSTYATSESSARSRLYGTGERIARDSFPLGVGFGRFASYASRLYYSPVYREYDLNAVWGLSPEYPKFIDDTSWPSVLGETGYGGLAIYAFGAVVLILALLRALRGAPRSERWAPLAALCATGVFVVDSLGDPTLFNWLAATTFAMLLGPSLLSLKLTRRRQPTRVASAGAPSSPASAASAP